MRSTCGSFCEIGEQGNKGNEDYEATFWTAINRTLNSHTSQWVGIQLYLYVSFFICVEHLLNCNPAVQTSLTASILYDNSAHIVLNTLSSSDTQQSYKNRERPHLADITVCLVRPFFICGGSITNCLLQKIATVTSSACFAFEALVLVVHISPRTALVLVREELVVVGYLLIRTAIHLDTHSHHAFWHDAIRRW